MKSFLFAFVLLFTLPQQTFASTCPPPPVPLRQLVQNSEYIVVGTIHSKEEVTTDYYTRLKIELEVL